MTKLLSANFLRLRKTNLIWGSIGICVVLGALAALGEFQFLVSTGTDLSVPEVAQYKAPLDKQFFQYASYIGILAAVFIPLFFGTEYSDGAIRNKVMTGHSRVAIYLVNLITGFAASLMCMAGYMLSCLVVGTPLLGWFTKPYSLILTAIFGSVLMLAAFCAIFTFVTMNISRKSTSVLICVLGVFLLLILALYLFSRLDAPETYQGLEMNSAGEMVWQEYPNDQYISGTKREIYQFIYDLLPAGQSLQYTGLIFTDPGRLMVMSLALSVLFTGAGAALFRRKDLK